MRKTKPAPTLLLCLPPHPEMAENRTREVSNKRKREPAFGLFPGLLQFNQPGPRAGESGPLTPRRAGHHEKDSSTCRGVRRATWQPEVTMGVLTRVRHSGGGSWDSIREVELCLRYRAGELAAPQLPSP